MAFKSRVGNLSFKKFNIESDARNTGVDFYVLCIFQKPDIAENLTYVAACCAVNGNGVVTRAFCVFKGKLPVSLVLFLREDDVVQTVLAVFKTVQVAHDRNGGNVNTA